MLTEALQADYWKPVQTGLSEGTDSDWVRDRLSNGQSVVHPEVFRLELPASPHIAAREEGNLISVNKICSHLPKTNRILIVEGAGGLLVPLNDSEFFSDLIQALNARVLLVSRNYLGSINHSLLTARVCRQLDLPVSGWIFNDQFQDYEEEIVQWSGYPRIASIPFAPDPGKDFIAEGAALIRKKIAAFT